MKNGTFFNRYGQPQLARIALSRAQTSAKANSPLYQRQVVQPDTSHLNTAGFFFHQDPCFMHVTYLAMLKQVRQKILDLSLYPDLHHKLMESDLG